ncbi:SMP-30/gluconolactonase/LRE family protein [Hyphobacterium sp.]|uniref:SMP-30/gluconolactonase/LRE family protein n=1 Tax=Hyphobacterium sp. TaxID=2004662 RepID=UPI003B520987
MTPLACSEPEIVWPARAILGEGPVWCSRGQSVYWVDIKGLALHRYTPETGARDSWQADEAIGCIDVPGADGSLLAATRSGFAQLVPKGDGTVERRALASPERRDYPGNRFNDGKRAPDGSFWAGTMDDAEKADSGAWWRLDPESGAATCLERGYRVTNGPAFDVARRRVYLTDSARQTVFMADWISGGGFDDKQVFAHIGDGDGYPDGMQVHADGSLWIAFWDGACLRRFAPDGTLVQTIDLPVQRPTSLAFAPELNSVFVTSASIGLEGEGEGALLRLDLG